MKPIYENIDLHLNSSLKVGTFNYDTVCEQANWHIHPEYELVYIKNGRGILRIANRTISYSNGALLFLGPNIPHWSFGNRDYRDNLEVVIQFNQNFVNQKLLVFPEFKKIIQLIERSKNVLVFDEFIKTKLASSFENFTNLNHTEKLIQTLDVLEKLSLSDNYRSILAYVEEYKYKTNEVDRLQTVFNYVNLNFGSALSTEQLASKIGLTPNSFCRFFKKMTNRSFIQFLNEFRIQKASELFIETSLSISEVMYQCGYNDPSYFARQFKKYKIHTPTLFISLKGEKRQYMTL